MTTKTIYIEHTSSETCWIEVVDATGKLFDFDDDTFKTRGSGTTPYVVASVLTSAGTGRSLYGATVDLAAINPTGSLTTYFVAAYEQAGGSPDAATDRQIDSGLMTVQFGAEDQREVKVIVEGTIDGSDIELQAWLEIDGQLADLDTIDDAATCDIQLWEHDAGSYVFQVDDADDAAFALSANQTNHFEFLKTSVIAEGLDNSSAFLRCTITENGNAWSVDLPVSVFGGN
jgi:hypothetical protein